MNNFSFIIKLLFILLLQVLICNQINFLGYINPYIYVSFVFLFPLIKNRFTLLLSAFIYGLSIDFFSDTGGIHAFSLVFVSYIRLFFLKIILRNPNIDFLNFNLWKEPSDKIFSYVLTLTVIHHFLMFSLANFSLTNILNTLSNTVYSSIFTILIYFLGVFLFQKKAPL